MQDPTKLPHIIIPDDLILTSCLMQLLKILTMAPKDQNSPPSASNIKFTTWYLNFVKNQLATINVLLRYTDNKKCLSF
jgi:hypothetical protein